jgi:hypothetical protein
MGGVLSSRLIGNFERGCCQIIIQLFLGVLQRRGFFSASFKKGFVKLCYKSFPNYHPFIFGVFISLFFG